MVQVFYFGTGVLAVCAALICLGFALVGGLGWGYVFPTFFSLLLLVCGLGRAVWKPRFGALLSVFGVLLGAGALLGDIGTLVWSVWPGYISQLRILLVPPGVLLLVMGVHGWVAAVYWGEGGES